MPHSVNLGLISRIFISALALIATPLLASPAKEIVREQRHFMINGAQEVWRLIWLEAPHDGKN